MDVAVRAWGVDRQRVAAGEPRDRAVEDRRRQIGTGSRQLLGVLILRRTRLDGPEAAGRIPVAGIDDCAGLAGDHLRAAERVVELMHGEEGPHPERVDLLEARVDLRGSALGHVVLTRRSRRSG